MELVADMCPNIAQVKFFYDSEILCEIKTLQKFSRLQDLRLNGGDFNKDPLRPLIENIGHQFTNLEFNHVDGIGETLFLLKEPRITQNFLPLYLLFSNK